MKMNSEELPGWANAWSLGHRSNSSQTVPTTLSCDLYNSPLSGGREGLGRLIFLVMEVELPGNGSDLPKVT